MNLKNYLQYRDYVKNNDFYSRYKNTKTFLNIFSWVGTALLIFFGYFLLYELIKPLFDVYINDKELGNIIAVVVSSILILSFELVKRNYIETFSYVFIRNKNKLDDREINISLIIVTLLVTLSTIISVNGVSKFADVNKEIEQSNNELVNTYSDSLMKQYEPLIIDNNKEILLLTDMNKQLIKSISNTENIWKKNKLKSEIDFNDKRINKLKSDISLIKNERDSLISQYEQKYIINLEKTKEESNESGKYFKFTSLLFEIFVIIGIYFSTLFNFRSYTDNEHLYDKIIVDFENRMSLLNILYMNGNVKIGDSVMSMSELYEKSKTNDLSITKSFSDEFYRDLDRIGVIKINNNVDKEFILDYKQAIKKVNDIFSKGLNNK